jgi:hypothetical protein
LGLLLLLLLLLLLGLLSVGGEKKEEEEEEEVVVVVVVRGAGEGEGALTACFSRRVTVRWTRGRWDRRWVSGRLVVGEQRVLRRTRSCSSWTKSTSLVGGVSWDMCEY